MMSSEPTAEAVCHCGHVESAHMDHTEWLNCDLAEERPVPGWDWHEFAEPEADAVAAAREGWIAAVMVLADVAESCLDDHNYDGAHRDYLRETLDSLPALNAAPRVEELVSHMDAAIIYIEQQDYARAVNVLRDAIDATPVPWGARV